MIEDTHAPSVSTAARSPNVAYSSLAVSLRDALQSLYPSRYTVAFGTARR